MPVETIYQATWRVRRGGPRKRTVLAPTVPDYGGALSAFIGRLLPMQIAALADAANTEIPIYPGAPVGEEAADSRSRVVEGMAARMTTSAAQDTAAGVAGGTVSGKGGRFGGGGATGSWGGRGGTGASGQDWSGGAGYKGGGSFDKIAPELMANLQRDFGLSRTEAAAVLGNLGHESGGFKHFNQIGGGGGVGYAQWTSADRKAAFFRYAKSHGLDPRSKEANYGFLREELRGKYAGAIRAVKAARTPKDKLVAFENAYERAGVKAYGSRYAYMQRALQLAPGKAGQEDTVEAEKKSQDKASQEALADLSNKRGQGRANFMHGQYGAAGTNLTVIQTAVGPVTANKAAAPAMKGFVNDLVAAGAPIKAAYSYSYRQKVGARGLSQHAYGNALDIDQLGRNVTKAQFAAWGRAHPEELRALEKKWGMVGGQYWRNPDWGHWEWGGGGAVGGQNLPGAFGGSGMDPMRGTGMGGGPGSGRGGYGPGGIGGHYSIARPASATTQLRAAAGAGAPMMKGAGRGGVGAPPPTINKYIQSLSPRYREMAMRQFGRMTGAYTGELLPFSRNIGGGYSLAVPGRFKVLDDYLRGVAKGEIDPMARSSQQYNLGLAALMGGTAFPPYGAGSGFFAPDIPAGLGFWEAIRSQMKGSATAKATTRPKATYGPSLPQAPTPKKGYSQT